MELPIFQKKGNTKKRRNHRLSSEKMLGMTFLASLIVHLIAIYMIPAVDLFSEGLGDAYGEIIEVDFIAEEFPEEVSVIQPEENQFLAAQPLPVETAPQSEEQVPVVEPEIPDPPEVERPLEDFTLLARTLESEPEFNIERKRPTPEPEAPARPTPEIPKMEKLSVKRELLRPEIQERLETPALQKPPATPNQAEQQKPLPKDERLQFPVSMPALTTHSSATENSADQPLGFSSKRPARPLAQETPLTTSTRDGGIPSSKRRLVGLDKDSAQDKNRPGIFAGEKFELPQMKETVQDASIQEGPEILVTEETAQAKALEVNPQIEGPVRGRAIVYKPTPPELADIENEVELRLKFWVLPDGTIGEVIPLKRGDAQLERIAIAYLKKWQFEPLTPDVPQQKIWGTIPIVFTAR